MKSKRTIRKLTPERLRALVLEEKKKILKNRKLKESKGASNRAKQVKPGREGAELVNKIDYVKQLGMTESKLKDQIKKVADMRKKVKLQILEEL